MNRPKYKELYQKERTTNEALKYEIEYYKQCLKYMNDKNIIRYRNKLERSPYFFGYRSTTLIEVDETFRLEFYKNISTEEYEKEVEKCKNECQEK